MDEACRRGQSGQGGARQRGAGDVGARGDTQAMLTVDQLLEQHDRVSVQAERQTPCGIEQIDSITGGFVRARYGSSLGRPGRGAPRS